MASLVICLKYLLLIFNVIFWITGAVLLAIGIWFLVDSNVFVTVLHMTGLSDTLLKAAAIVLIVVGGLVFFVGVLGCAATCQENAQCLVAFSSILILLLAAQIVTGILAGIYRNKVLEVAASSLNNSLTYEYGVNNYEPATDSWNFVQTELKCCGIEGPIDWLQSSWYNDVTNQTAAVPVSCCVLTSNSEPVNQTACISSNTAIATATYRHQQGCETLLTSWLSNHIAILIGVAIGLIVIQFLGIMMACCLGCNIRNKGIIN